MELEDRVTELEARTEQMIEAVRSLIVAMIAAYGIEVPDTIPQEWTQP